MTLRVDELTPDDLRAGGSVKWTTFPETIGAFVAEMDFGIAPPVAAALVDAVQAGTTGYLPEAWRRRIGTATAGWYRDAYGWQPDPDRVHALPDVITAFETALLRHTAPGDAVVIPTPAYMPFLTVPEQHDRRVVQVPSIERDGRFLVDLDGVARAFGDGAGLLVLCNPHNPLGTVMTRRELADVAAVVEANAGRVFVDEVHAPLVYTPARHVPYASVSDAAAAHSMTAASASKAWNLAGVKCAQLIVTADDDAADWEQFGAWAEHRTSTLGVVANVAAYEHGRPWLDEVLAYLDGNRALLVETVASRMPAARLAVPEGTYIAFIDLRAYGLDGPLDAWFRERAGVSMTDGAACGEAGEGFVRLVFATPRKVLAEALDRVADALAQASAPR